MSISRELLDQLRYIVRPIAIRVANTVTRGMVTLVDPTTKLPRLQLEVLKGEIIDGAEYHQPYGFYSVPLVGAEHVTLFPNGDRSHPLTLTVSDRRHSPTGGKPGDITIRHYKGAKIIMNEDGDIEVQPAPGRELVVRDAAGNADRLVKKSEYDGHTHGPGTFTTPVGAGGGGPVTGASGGAAAVTGTQRMRVQ